MKLSRISTAANRLTRDLKLEVNEDDPTEVLNVVARPLALTDETREGFAALMTGDVDDEDEARAALENYISELVKSWDLTDEDGEAIDPSGDLSSINSTDLVLLIALIMEGMNSDPLESAPNGSSKPSRKPAAKRRRR